MNRIISIRSVVLAISFAALSGIGCASETIGEGERKQPDELAGAQGVRVEQNQAESEPEASQGGVLPLESHPVKHIGPSPEPWEDGNGSGPSPEPWRTSASDPSTKTGCASGDSSGESPDKPAAK